FTQQKFVRALEFNPCTLANVHHIEISVDTTGTLANEEANTTGYGLNFSSVTGINQSRLLSLYHIGERVTQFPLGMGYRIPAGADLILQVHYLPTFVSIDDSISMNVFFDDTTVHQEVKTIAIDENDLIEPEFFVIKNQIKNLHHIQEICGDWSLISISPQLAIIGKSVKVFSVGTANDTTDLIQIQVWENSLRYLYYFPLAQGITSGSTIYSDGTFDNTENNPNNPYKPPANFTHDCLNCEDDFKIYLQLIGSTDCMVTAECIVSGIEEQHSISSFDFLLKPNPANDQLTISFSLPSASAITVTVYDLNERMKKIISLNAEEEKFTAGNHSITFSTLDLPQGIYFCKLQTENSISTEKLIVQR
ncbi:MAG: T9SS type A sorting domain-containing protein, partial [Chitinophagales bacterium]|nr:T9SS type A sorting domain-containing protein [Chitinophagales bacterium]